MTVAESTNVVDDDTLVWKCHTEYCDGPGWHADAPYPFLAWRIDPKGSIEEYQAYEDNHFVIPATEGEVRPIVAWRMPCGAWFGVQPLHATLAEVKRVQELGG